MKNKKLKLDELKVKSFVTQTSDQNYETIKGGGDSRFDACPSAPVGCDFQTVIGCTITILRTLNCSWDDGCGSALGCIDTRLTKTVVDPFPGV
ncbi:hypothetical protein C900_00145 [Fulvivirga imtechensis AK7]|uniref:Uncharacterized protein n=1 Tax=Fulvivirga imtechensis AK7 TaxID=1237149 RepID=L8JW93_9BACT|nr:pinensin family lanthipeptide [Fulvivirga imtechensis]ELR73065.1 hypothetical protein C900_00145 [Fulvivirga imtechensis AK7]